jgi:hypothetical protein
MPDKILPKTRGKIEFRQIHAPFCVKFSRVLRESHAAWERGVAAWFRWSEITDEPSTRCFGALKPASEDARPTKDCKLYHDRVWSGIDTTAGIANTANLKWLNQKKTRSPRPPAQG